MLALIPPAFTAPALPGSAPSPARGTAAPAEPSFSRQLEKVQEQRAQREQRTPEPARASAQDKPASTPKPAPQATGQQPPKPAASPPKQPARAAHAAAPSQAKTKAMGQAAAADPADAADTAAVREMQADVDATEPTDTDPSSAPTISELLARWSPPPEAQSPAWAPAPVPNPLADGAALPLTAAVPLIDAAKAADAPWGTDPAASTPSAGAVTAASTLAGAGPAAALINAVPGRPAAGDALALAPTPTDATNSATAQADLRPAPPHATSGETRELNRADATPSLAQQAQAVALLAQAATISVDSRATDPRFADGRRTEATGALDTAALAGGLTGPGNTMAHTLAHTLKAAEVVTANLATPATSAEFRAALGMQVSLLARGGVQHAELHLNPAEMGPVSIQIVLDGQEAQVNFGADSAHTRQIIESGMPELASALREAGLTLTGGGVSQHAGGQRQDPGSNQGSRGRDASVNSDATADKAVDQRMEQARRSIARRALGGVDLFA